MKIKSLPHKSILDKLLLFRPSTGEFFWKIRRGGKAVAGSKAGWIHTNPRTGKQYLKISINGIDYLAHRIAFFLDNGFEPAEIDHMDGNSLNNRPENLRPSNDTINNNNALKRKDNKTGIIGVSYDKFNTTCPWVAKYGGKEFVKKHGTHKHFATLEEAIAQRKAWEKMYGMTEIKKHLKPSP